MKITIMVPKFHENSQKRAKDDCQNGRRGNEHEPRLHAIWCNRCTNSSHSLENQGAQSLYSKQFHSFCRRLYYFLVPLLSDCPLAFFHAQASIIILFLILIYCGIVWAEVTARASHVTCSDCYCDASFWSVCSTERFVLRVSMNHVVF